MNNNKTQKYVICVNNHEYEASLELRKIYQVVSDNSANKNNMIRVIDESGEDYLYPQDYFVPIDLPETAENVFSAST